MSYYFSSWRPYVPVAEKRRRSELKLKKLKKNGQSVAPVRIEGRKIATSFWGKSWCANLERYSDYENRLPRGRSYVRNGSVLDLQIAEGEVVAMVSGSDLYKVKATIAPVAARRWKAICRDCAGIHRFPGRAAAGAIGERCHGSRVPGRRRPVSLALGNQAFLQLSGLGGHVQACRCRALWRRGAIGSKA